MILTREKIIEEIKNGRIVIDPPVDEKDIGPASLDLHIGDKFRVFKKTHEVCHVKDGTSCEDVTELVRVKDYFLLMPGETVHGITRERITLPPDICGWLEGRSRYARLGLLVHISASFMQPGINNHQVLELNNVAPIPLAIYPGTKIAQFVFQRTEGEARYEGKYKDQDEP